MNDYQQLTDLMVKWSSLYGAYAILNWDKATMMPKGSHSLRAEQMSVLSTMQHEIIASQEIAELLDRIDITVLNDWQKANIREIHRLHIMAIATSPTLTSRLTRAAVKCEEAWYAQANEINQQSLEQNFEELLALTREMASSLGEKLGISSYDALLEQHQPGLRAESVDAIFSKIEPFTSRLVATIKDSPKQQTIWPRISKNQQKKFANTLMVNMEFDFNTGRLDESRHPFTGGLTGDIRVCSYFKPENILLSISALMHETGHASYEARLPKQHLGQPVSDSRGMCIHESLALLFERQVGHSNSYLGYLAKQLENNFGYADYFNKERLCEHFNTIHTNGIRVTADDFTYPAHILIRYKIENELLSGELSAKHLKGRWQELFELYFGISPSPHEGPWQDIHWAIGYFGYFPCYLMGAVISAQLFNNARKNPSIEMELSRGKFSSLLQWLDKKIYRQGCYHEFEDLVIASCGVKLSADDFIKNLERRLK
ncbi:carboxypeptidase M32 [Photorhabdus heterorhabditis]|uniref:Metal-dependent carboxypeptidase n=1 Tax=Photorhabdus heterorhabditis TaxID=880156 RepID=A0ABR5K8D9_9GAMM|nr:carboxypeptidase M32 [Photorhabdus heterorhabditis]KOY60642.1 carboxypeptidase [Photorhabdus heterorhabditis]MBS9440621.1 carboxypeptidase [Photorhabdus heterorhabditis]